MFEIEYNLVQLFTLVLKHGKRRKKIVNGPLFRPSKNVNFVIFPKKFFWVYDAVILQSCSMGSLLRIECKKKRQLLGVVKMCAFTVRMGK